MEKEERFLKIKNFLKAHRFLHEKEIMERYPSGFNVYEDWIKELSTIDSATYLKLNNTLDKGLITNEGLKNFLKTSKDLLNLERENSNGEILDFFIRKKLTPKKEYEISKILKLTKELSFNKVVDIGGGVGHLGMSLAFYQNKNITCIDMDSNFQNLGRKKIDKWVKGIKDLVHFIPLKVDDETKFTSYQDQKTLITGLHACGPLSTYIVKKTVEEKFDLLINFSCCYHKLEDEYNISSVSKKDPLYFTKHALTVAAKSNTPLTVKSYEDKMRVKRYRYPLQFYLTDHLDLPFVEIGNTKESDYQLSFGEYAKKFLAVILKDKTENELNDYFNHKRVKELTLSYIKGGILRTILGRLIEIYIVLDRALYLEEHGYKTLVIEYFDNKISPRNLLLFASRKDEKLPSFLRRDFASSGEYQDE